MAFRKTTYLESQKYSADDDRAAIFAALQAGVFDPGDMALTVSGMQLTLAAGRALVPNRSANALYLGKYFVVNDSGAAVQRTVPANTSGLPRLDQVLLIANDSANGSASDLADLVIDTGTPTTGATLDNRSGATTDATLTTRYGNWLRIAESATANGAATVTLRDRRGWARGGYSRILRSSNAAAGNDYTTSSTTMVDLDTTNLAIRLECSGNPVRMILEGRGFTATNAGAAPLLGFAVDGAVIDGGQQYGALDANATGTNQWPLSMTYDFVPAAGSHIIRPQFSVSAGSVSVYARAALPLVFVVEERPRQNANNGTA